MLSTRQRPRETEGVRYGGPDDGASICCNPRLKASLTTSFRLILRASYTCLSSAATSSLSVSVVFINGSMIAPASSCQALPLRGHRPRQRELFRGSGARLEGRRRAERGSKVAGSARTYSLMTNRFPNHTSLYVRVEDKDSGMVYSTFSLGQIIAFDQPQAEFDRSNQLHVLYCAAPRNWSYARIGLNGELLSRASFAETKTRPRLVHSDEGVVKIAGGMMETPVTQATRDTAPKLSARPPNAPKDD